MHGFSPHLPPPLQKAHQTGENLKDKVTQEQVKDQTNSKVRSRKEAWALTLSALETGALQTPTLKTHRESTLSNFRKTIDRFLRFVETATYSESKSWTRYNEKALQRFFDLFLESLDVAITTKRNCTRDVSIILNPMVEHGVIEQNPLYYRTKKTKRTQSEKAQKKNEYAVFSIDEFGKIVNTMDEALDQPSTEGVCFKYLQNLL
ncbi:MAG: hypothetical protein HY962_15585 [Ignavibacteriae bacterium]|nr:hypothetical protein [Ignavibacteriota bacterium]